MNEVARLKTRSRNRKSSPAQSWVQSDSWLWTVLTRNARPATGIR